MTNVQELRNSLIEDYSSEADFYRRDPSSNVIASRVPWVELHRDREYIPASEIVEYCTNAIQALRRGEDPEKYNY